MGKVDQNKQIKLEKLLDSAQHLFMSKGILDTSISDITSHAGVAKGTFYLYFKDKYSIRDHLVCRSALKLFVAAHEALQQEEENLSFEDRVIFITDYIVNELEQNRPLLKFIAKNLSWGLFRHIINEDIAQEHMTGIEIFEKIAKECGVKVKDPDIMLFIIMEMTSATVYSSIIGNESISYDKLMPYLNDTIRAIVRNHLA